jgi:6-phospho-beta-glucosidase
MDDLKIAIIGAGSGYTSELIEEISKQEEILNVRQVVLYDIDENRLGIMGDFCTRYLKAKGSNIKLKRTGNLTEAVEGAQFIDTQIRVGGNKQRVMDEKIPLKYGLLGQETTGAGGMFKAFRTIPVMLEIAREIEKVNPDAWIVNYTNPTGLITEALIKKSKVKIAGLCSGGLFPKWWAKKALGVDEKDVDYDYVGLNHMNFAYNLKIGGRSVSDQEFDKIAEASNHGEVNFGLMKKLRLIPSPYIKYFFHRSKVIEELKSKKTTRGEDVLEIEKEVFKAFSDPQQVTIPEILYKRGGGGYSEVAISIIKAIYTDTPKKIVVNVPNNGAIKWLPDDAVIETPCLVNSAGIKPLAVPELPETVWGLISAVKNYEQLAVEAALTGSLDLAELALLAHPLIGDWELIKPLMKEMMDANSKFLPQFKHN